MNKEKRGKMLLLIELLRRDRLNMGESGGMHAHGKLIKDTTPLSICPFSITLIKEETYSARDRQHSLTDSDKKKTRRKGDRLKMGLGQS